MRGWVPDDEIPKKRRRLRARKNPDLKYICEKCQCNMPSYAGLCRDTQEALATKAANWRFNSRARLTSERGADVANLNAKLKKSADGTCQTDADGTKKIPLSVSKGFTYTL